MMIFTDTHALPRIRTLRALSLNAACTRYNVQDLSATFTANLTDWRSQQRLDKERHLHRSHHLYVIWNQKSEWLHQVSKLNPFQSEYFFWADSGQFRARSFFDSLAETNWYWISRPDYIPEDKILLLSLQPFESHELMVQLGEESFISPLTVRVGGGNFGGKRDAIELWRNTFYTKLLAFVESGRFAGKDQPIMASACIDHPSLCWFVAATSVGFYDPWFAMQSVLHGMSVIPVYNPYIAF